MKYKIKNNIYNVHYVPCDLAFYLFNSALRNLHVKEYYLTFRYNDNNWFFFLVDYAQGFGVFFLLVGFYFLSRFILGGFLIFLFLISEQAKSCR